MTNEKTAAAATDIRIEAADGWVLSGTLFHRVDSHPKCVALINAGAGLSQRYYVAFAEFLAAAQIATLTYDYRGIGKSRPNHLRGFQASVEEWGSKDCAAALQWLNRQFPQAPLGVIGHSVGALLPGFVTNGPVIDKMLLVGGHTGYWRDYRASARLPMYLMWHVAMPSLAKIMGYFPGSLFGLDDLPLGVALQWAERKRPELWWNVGDVRRVAEIRAQFAGVKADTLMLRFTDDVFATESAARRLRGLYVGCSMTERCLPPRAARLPRAGHFAFFRRNCAELWPDAARWLLPGSLSA